MRDVIGSRSARADRGGQEAAQAIGVEALVFLAAEPELAGRFLQMSGLEADDLRQAAADPSFFPALLDFILADEKTLHDFAAQSGRSAETIARARRAYDADTEWTD